MVKTKGNGIRPEFLYIGTSKAGSSWIYEILREHPEVFVPPAKDIQFFDTQYNRGIEWYLSFFKPKNGEKVVGELSHDYFMYEKSAVRIKKCLPTVKLICSLREPTSQIISNFLQHRTAYLSKSTSLENFAFQDNTLKACDYFFNLLPYYDLFPAENILVLFFDDLQRDPALFARKIYKFLDVDPTFTPKILRRKDLPAREPRIVWLAFFAYKTGLIFRKLGLTNLVGSVKRNNMFKKALFKQVKKKPEISDELKGFLKRYFKERYKDLPELIGQPLPEGWF